MGVGVDAVGRVVSVPDVRALRPDQQFLEEMLSGWRNQQLSRSLSLVTIAARERLVRQFIAHAGEMPWRWGGAHVDDFFGDLRSEHQARPSTLRGYQVSLQLFCDYVTDPAYGWAEACMTAFGSHPSQVCHEWNTATHVQHAEASPGKRAFTKAEAQRVFDRAGDETDRIARLRRKGWLPPFRDATASKLAYAYGWHLGEVMARYGVRSTADLAPLLAERGITLSASQVHRLVTQTSERVSLQLLAALSDIFSARVDDLIATSAVDAPVRRRRGAGDGPVVDLATTIRPQRDRVLPEEA